MTLARVQSRAGLDHRSRPRLLGACASHEEGDNPDERRDDGQDEQPLDDKSKSDEQSNDQSKDDQQSHSLTPFGLAAAVPTLSPAQTRRDFS